MLFKEQQLGLLAPLPLRNVLEAVDVPPDEFGQLGGGLLCAGEGRGVLQGDFAMLAPSLRSRPVREGLGPLVSILPLRRIRTIAV